MTHYLYLLFSILRKEVSLVNLKLICVIQSYFPEAMAYFEQNDNNKMNYNGEI